MSFWSKRRPKYLGTGTKVIVWPWKVKEGIGEVDTFEKRTPLVRSSAYRRDLTGRLMPVSFITRLNRVMLSADPWGVPVSRGFMVDSTPLTATLNVRLLTKFRMNWEILMFIAKSWSFFRIRKRHAVWKTFFRLWGHNNTPVCRER